MAKRILVATNLEGPEAIEAINEALDGLYRGISNENIRPGVEAGKIRHFRAENVVLGTDEVPVQHGLGVVPLEWNAMRNASGDVWESRPGDPQFVYLIAEAAMTATVVIKG